MPLIVMHTYGTPMVLHPTDTMETIPLFLRKPEFNKGTNNK